MSLKLGNTPIAGISTHTNVNAHSLFDCKWADHKLNEISWLEASTFSWQSGDVYTSAYNHLVADLQGTTAETETIGSYTVTFYRATDGHKICLADQEQTVLNIYNTYGIAWYYILDTTNTRFKLPRTKYGFEGLRTNVGDVISESLPNIKGNFGVRAGVDTYIFSGALGYRRGNNNTSVVTNSNSTQDVQITFDASRSSSTYQDNAPVQERATQMYLYFYVGDYTQSAIEQTAGLNAELFNGKADRDLSNITSIAPVLGMLQNTDSSKVGYIISVFIATASVYAPSGGKWLVLKNDQTVLNTAQMYELGGVIGAKVGEIINGGDLVADYTAQAQQFNVGLNVTLLKIQ